MAQEASQPRPQPPHRNLMTIGLWVLMFAGLTYLLFSGFQGPGGPAISYDKLRSLIQDNKVAAVTLRGHEIRGQFKNKLKLGKGEQPVQYFDSRAPQFGADDLIPLLEKHGVKIDVAAPERGGWWAVVVSMLPWILFIGAIFWVGRRMMRITGGGPGGGQLGQFMRRSVRKAERPNVTFADVAGEEPAKREVSELVDYLRHPEQFDKLGAKVPKGVLLYGPPGTGKTLLSRALAGEADVPFYSISGSEFIEMFVGVGASRVRNLFAEAKKNTPSIIFIDELDSIGRKRGTGLGGGHDEREQTLNQILAEMDGFEPHDAVIVMAATNRPDVLDPALLRPGRFDRHVSVDMPDRKGRLETLQIYVRKVPLGKDVDLSAIAAGTPGFSGADLKNLVNEAALLTAREKRKHVTASDFEQARDKITMGPERPIGFTEQERRRLAVHEGGHAFVGYHLPNADPVYKVSIIPRGRALGGTQQLPRVDRYTYPESYLRDRLAVMLGGRAAELIALGDASSGSEQDIREATQLARAMVTRWGMSRDVGPIDLSDHDSNPFLGEELAKPRRHSERSAVMIDRAVRHLIDQAQERAHDVIRGGYDKYEGLVDELIKEETLYSKQIAALLGDGHEDGRSRGSPSVQSPPRRRYG